MRRGWHRPGPDPLSSHQEQPWSSFSAPKPAQGLPRSYWRKHWPSVSGVDVGPREGGWQSSCVLPMGCLLQGSPPSLCLGAYLLPASKDEKDKAQRGTVGSPDSYRDLGEAGGTGAQSSSRALHPPRICPDQNHAGLPCPWASGRPRSWCKIQNPGRAPSSGLGAVLLTLCGGY